jgi:hypothetical protein
MVAKEQIELHHASNQNRGAHRRHPCLVTTRTLERESSTCTEGTTYHTGVVPARQIVDA